MLLQEMMDNKLLKEPSKSQTNMGLLARRKDGMVIMFSIEVKDKLMP